MFETLENNPTLRERVLGMTAIAAVLIGGAAGVDTMLTSGWQIGGTGGAPVVYAETSPQQYFDDVGRDLSNPRPQRVQLAAQDAVVTAAPSQGADVLEGSNAPAIAPAPQPPPTPASDAQQLTADQQFEAIENDVRQATAALAPETAPKDASESASPS